jgi:predicted ATPase
VAGQAARRRPGHPAVHRPCDGRPAGFQAGRRDHRDSAADLRALDGLPLAIELAAARMRTHDVADLAARLDDRFRLLSRGSRTADPRHQTLRAVVAWSWDLLSGEEQVLARRLTVFSGSATAASARLVCAMPGAADLLDSLVEKSLVPDS